MPYAFDHATFAAAAQQIDGVVHQTPMVRSPHLSEIAGVPVLLKAENLQTTGSFKLRGAFTRLSRLSDEEKQQGVVAASAGNHAQGVAFSAQRLGIPARIVMPEDAALPKVEATRRYGAEVVLSGPDVAAALTVAMADAERSGRTFIHPYDHEDVVAGQGTLGLEILDQVPDVGTILVPTGGGGLLAGVAAAVHSVRPEVAVVGVQAESAAAWPESLAVGHPVQLERLQTMADGIAVALPGEVPFGLIRDHVASVDTVSEELISHAMLLLAERAKLVVEPSGAAGVAALLEEPGIFEGPVVAILSGGNVDPLVLLRSIRHGMRAVRRYLKARVIVTDTPGSLAALLVELAATGANVIDITHSRTTTNLAVGEVAVTVDLETKGPEHCADVITHLRDRGYSAAEH
ncbi:threonine ammonia-lyase [Bogoriella caseilytica]|uniref:L-threonine dehydratase catabolic TdcB n=1 Tax=Bogoriella caseilytica TaxID=56055 RepID=A0A3N2BAX1_9MICO|nr:threonine ammonia-lyase [Bogoriella caseilytica]ROR72214.1 L-threonine ammonia-lyase [Bogoriella caseilytica]